MRTIRICDDIERLHFEGKCDDTDGASCELRQPGGVMRLYSSITGGFGFENDNEDAWPIHPHVFGDVAMAWK